MKCGEAKSDNGSSIRIKLSFARNTPTKAKVEQTVISGATPNLFRIYRIEQAVDLVRSVPLGADRATLSVTGQPLQSLFDGSEQLITVISLPGTRGKSVYRDRKSRDVF